MRTISAVILSAVFLVALLALLLTPAAPVTRAGAPIVVETETDDFQVNSSCTLRDAVLSANFDADAGGDCEQGNGTDTIMVPAGTYELDGFMIAGPLELTEDVQIIGDGAGNTFIDGLDSIRIFIVATGVDVTISGVTLRNGYTDENDGGGAIHNDGSLTITDSILEDNHSDGAHGGAINSSGATNLHIEDSILRRNRGDISGGAIAAGGGPCGTVSLLRVTIERNSAWTYGGGINTCGSLTIRESVVRANLVEWAGGGVFNLGDALIQDSLISGNEVDGDLEQNGGGIRNGNSGTLTVERSLITGNSALHGGGISSAGEATVINTTLSDNFAASGGGGFSSGDNHTDGPAHASLLNVTIAGNAGGTAPAGIIMAQDTAIGGPLGTVELTNTIVAPDEGGIACVDAVTIVSLGHNISTDDTCGLDATGDQQNSNPLLAGLGDNGGLTDTHALLAGSPALGAADQVACPDEDQRAEPRPQGDGCDIGAFESALTAPTPTPSPPPTATPTPTGTAQATPTPTPTPTVEPTPTPDTETLVWGDHNCSGSPDPIDALFNLRDDAGLPTDTGECPEMGVEVDVLEALVHQWGDVDCNDTIDPVDGLKLLRYDAGLDVQQEEGCPEIGEPIG